MACSVNTILNDSHRLWRGSRDKDGHREYHITHRVRVTNTATVEEGPAIALQTPGLPLPGSIWAIDGDLDLFAVCQWDATMTPVVDDGERSEFFDVEQVYRTKPNDKCIDIFGTGTGNPINDPLAEHPIISGRFVKYTEEKTLNNAGSWITNSAHERLRGPLVEFDASRLTVQIQKNEATLDLPTKLLLVDTVNANVIWGFAARKVKLSNITWQRKFSADCVCYFEVVYEFEVSPEGFDRQVMDEGTKALNGKWNKTTGVWELVNINGAAPDPRNPTHFVRMTDFWYNPLRLPLNGAGRPAVNMDGTGTADPGMILIEYYEENAFELAITDLPSTLECN